MPKYDGLLPTTRVRDETIVIDNDNPTPTGDVDSFNIWPNKTYPSPSFDESASAVLSGGVGNVHSGSASAVSSGGVGNVHTGSAAVANSCKPGAAFVVPNNTKPGHQLGNGRKIPVLTLSHFLTHFPKHPHCLICQRCKVQRAPCKIVGVDHSTPLPKQFADALTCDWGVMTDRCKARNDEIDCLLIMDRATPWKHVHASDSSAYEEVALAFGSFLGL